MIELSVQDSQIVKAHALLSHIEKGAPRAIAAALNRTIEGVKTDATKMITTTYDIKAGDVRPIIKAHRASASTLLASARASGGVIPLKKFRVLSSKPGTALRVSVKKSGGKAIKGAFEATMKEVGFGKNRRAAEPGEEHVGIFRRKGKARTPIKELYGPSVAQMMGEVGVIEYVSIGAADRFEKRLDHEIGRLLSKG